MPNKWKTARLEIKAFKNYVDTLPENAKKQASICHLLTKEELDKLLNQKSDGNKLDGIRIYLGAKIIDGNLVPTVHVVACEKDEDNSHQDYKIPEQGIDLENSDDAQINALMPIRSGGVPCPPSCGTKNVLNS